MLGDADFGVPPVHLVDDPVGIERLIGDQAAEGHSIDQGSDADCVMALAGQQNEPDQATERVGQRQDLGGRAAFGLAYGLAFSPPFAPCP